ncbi:MAG TPA: hypothetical protein VJ182_06890 [Anaerolineales bacterium]|nr:hypothetical protein [Anaerolineales bacterium]
MQHANTSGTTAAQLHTGDVFALGPDGKLEVVAIGARGAVFLIEWQQFSALVPVGLDLELLTDPGMLDLPPVDLLLLPDAGNPALSPPEWLANLSPQIIWVVAQGELGEETQFNLQGYRVLPSYQVGWSRITTDGYDIWLDADKP